MCCKTIFTKKWAILIQERAQARTSIQRKVRLDSTIARSRRSKEFCNTFQPKGDIRESSVMLAPQSLAHCLVALATLPRGRLLAQPADPHGTRLVRDVPWLRDAGERRRLPHLLGAPRPRGSEPHPSPRGRATGCSRRT